MMDIQERLRAALGASYRIERELGGGGMSRVFVAEEIALGRRVVIKVLPPELGSGIAADRFRQEVQVAAQLQHPHIVPVLQTGEADGLLYYTMPFVEGESLKERLQRDGRLSVTETVRIMRDVADALADAHAHGLVHRDIKPGNILISKQHAVVTDFGVAKALKAAAERGAVAAPGTGLTTIGLAIGTPTYMAPEQAAADPDADHRMDLYALGVVAYEMLSGKPPFGGTTPQAVLAAQLTQIQRPIREVRPEVPADLSALIDRLLKKQAAERFGSAAELRLRLEQPGFATTGSLAAIATVSGGWLTPGRLMIGCGVLAALLVVLKLTGVLGGRSLVAQGLLNERDAILIADMNGHGADSAIAASLTEALRIDLTQSKTIRLVDAPEISQTLALMQRPVDTKMTFPVAREVAQRSGAKAVLGGDLQPVGRGYLITAQLVTPDSGVTLAAFRETAADSSEVLPALDRLSHELRRKIGESLRSVNASTPLQQVSTSSLEALRKYSQAIRGFDLRTNSQQSIALLEESVRLDSGFAMAWRKLGVAYQAIGDQDKSQEALSRAFANKGRLTERERYLTIGSYYSTFDGEEPKAVQAYRALLEGTPNDPWALNNLALLYIQQRQFPQADSVLNRALQADSSTFTAFSNLITSQINQGRIQQAQALVATMRRHFPGNTGVDFLAADVQYAAGDQAGYQRTIELLASQSGSDPFIQLGSLNSLADLDLSHGHIAKADQKLAQMAGITDKLGRSEFSLNSVLRQAQVQLWLSDDRVGALKTIDQALNQHPMASIPVANRPYLFTAYLLAYAGEPARSRLMLAENARLQTPPAQGTGSFRLIIEAANAISEHRPADAPGLVEQAMQRGGCQVCNLPELARAWAAAGQPDSARSAYERFVSTPESNRASTDALDLPLAWQHLGVLYEQAGEREKARNAWGQVVEQWRDADPELQPRVQEAKRRLAALSGESSAR
ncbi:MAG: protein kinase [Gemmatimonadota bacterium]